MLPEGHGRGSAAWDHGGNGGAHSGARRSRLELGLGLNWNPTQVEFEPDSGCICMCRFCRLGRIASREPERLQHGVCVCWRMRHWHSAACGRCGHRAAEHEDPKAGRKPNQGGQPASSRGTRDQPARACARGDSGRAASGRGGRGATRIDAVARSGAGRAAAGVARGTPPPRLRARREASGCGATAGVGGGFVEGPPAVTGRRTRRSPGCRQVFKHGPAGWSGWSVSPRRRRSYPPSPPSPLRFESGRHSHCSRSQSGRAVALPLHSRSPSGAGIALQDGPAATPPPGDS